MLGGAIMNATGIGSRHRVSFQPGRHTVSSEFRKVIHPAVWSGAWGPPVRRLWQHQSTRRRAGETAVGAEEQTASESFQNLSCQDLVTKPCKKRGRAEITGVCVALDTVSSPS